MVVIITSGDESGIRSPPFHDIEAEDAAVKCEAAVDVCDFEMDVADPNVGIDGGCGGHGLPSCCRDRVSPEIHAVYDRSFV
jgi:hypothetical protein